MNTPDHISGYPVLEKLHETRGSVFYRTRIEKTGRAAVIQRLKAPHANPSELAVLKQDFRSLASKDYSHVLRHLDLLDLKDGTALILEDFKGIPISGLISSTPLSIEVFLDIAIQLAQALGELHQDDITHGALTPDHIFIDMNSGHVKLGGFGFIAQFTHENDAIHDGEVIKNTLAYISPEQTGRMNRSIDYRTDLYSLGICFYHMLTGSVPFMDLHPMRMFHAHIARHPVSPSDIMPSIPRPLSEIILRLLQKNA